MRAYQDMVFSTAVRLCGNEAQAEDISQQVFLKAYERFDELRYRETSGGWLKTVAINLSLNHLTRYRKRWQFFSEQPEMDFVAPGDEQLDHEDQQRAALVERALAALPEHQRVPLVLFHFEELSYQQIADQLKVSLAKVKADIFRGRSALAGPLSALGEDAGLEIAS
ncbi:MAG TPA: sigma-70 family RNA polymerase sigma factor [Steroidobacteraceae bacterium]|nr:sigma-70 family RNA polymerase sigma factor [Steroidobacteraceae bacterium]